MKEPAYKGKEPLPLSVYVSARAGDPQAVERLLRYYDNYMNCLCTRTLYDEDGYPHLCVDEYMKRCLEIRLIQRTLRRTPHHYPALWVQERPGEQEAVDRG